MPPPRSRPQPEDSRSEASSTKEKIIPSTIATINGKGRRVANSAATGSSLRDVVAAGPRVAMAGASGDSNSEARAGIQWTTIDASILHRYRYDYRLNTPASFNKTYNQLVLQTSPIGRMSPTMAPRKQQRRQGKDHFANSVRKHFNSMGIAENEVVVDFLYKVRWQDKTFRMRFAPQRPR